MTTIAGFLSILLGIAVASPAIAADSSFQHSTWTAGAVSGSTSPANNNWTGYDSDDGNIVIISTAFQSLTIRAGSWFQTDDSGSNIGFNRSTTSLSFSSTVVKGFGTAAGVSISTLEVVSIASNNAILGGRARMGVAYHPTLKKIYLFGGINLDATLSDEILEYDPTTGNIVTKNSKLASPTWGVAATFNAFVGRIILGGGVTTGGVIGDISEYEPGADAGVIFKTTLPNVRGRMGAAFDSLSKFVFFFGGENFTGNKLNEIVYYDFPSTVVTLSTPLPSARWDISASFDADRKTILLFGGEDTTGEGVDDIIEFNPTVDPFNTSTFTIRNAVLPSTRTQVATAYNLNTKKTLIFGGLSAAGINNDVLSYDPVTDAVSVRPTILTSSRTFIAARFSPETQRTYIFGGEFVPNGGRTTQILQHVALTSATFTSSVFDTGNVSALGTMSFSPTTPFDPSVGVSLSFRAGNTDPPSGTYTPIPNGGSLASFGPAQFIQYRATFTTTNVSTSSILSDVTITYTQTAPSATLVSSAFDLVEPLAIIRKLEFFGTFPSGTGAQFQLRTAPDSSGFPGTFGPWLGPTGGDFYTDPNGATAINPAHADGVADRFVQYRAILYSTSTLAAPNISSVTISFNVRPASPTISALVAISSEAIVLTTVDQSINEDEIIVSMGLATLPTVEGLVIPTLDKPGTGTVQISTIAGFAPNTQIFVRTRARNTADALDSVFSNEFSTFTLANEPISVGSLLVFGTSFTVSWNPNSNPAGTLYEVSLSTDNFNLNITTPVVFSDGLTGNTTDMVSLAGGTTYYVRVRARNQDLIETAFSAIFSTATRVSPITGLSGTGVGVSSVVFSWNSSGPSAQYRIFSATAGVLLATVQTASVAVTGLLTNSTFSIQVEPFNAVASAGLSEPATAFSQAAIPSALSAISLSSGSISLSWNASANPTGTPFKLLYSTDVFQTITTTAALFSNNFTGLTTTYVKLAVGTTHTFRISAQNGDGLDSPSIDIATQTFPGTVSAVTGVGLGVSSIAWNWTNSAGPTVEFYSIVRGSTGIEIATTAATTFNDTGLLPNTTFGLRIRAVNLTGPGALPAETTTHTLAQPPTATAIFVVFIDSITVSWSTNLNPSKTVYEVERSTDNAQFSLVAASAAASLIDLNLSGGTTYYYRVRAFNTPGIATDFDAVVSTFLAGKIPEPPIGFSARSLSGGRIHLSWTISPSTTVNTYNVYFDSGTGVIDYSVLFASVSIPTTSFNTVPLSIGTSYFFGLRAENEKNEEESNIHVVAAAVAIAAPAALVASIRAPPPGATIAGDHITLRAGLDEGTPFDVSQILFEFREVGVGGWTTVAAVDGVHPNPAVSEPFLTHWDTTGLTADGSFDLRAIARDGSGVDDPFPPSVRVRVSNTLPDVSENKGPGSQVIKRVRVHSFTETTLDVADGSGRFMLSVTFSSAATTGTEDILRIDTDPAFKPVFSSSFSPTGLISQITLESGQTNLNAGRTATISFSHLDKNSDNRVDGTSVRVDNLRIAVFDPILNEWILEIPSSISSKDETTLTGTTPHFSLFAVVSPAAAGLSEVRIYPNPFRPNNNIDNDGKPWTVGDQTSGIIFDGLPPSGEIRVYSVSGLLVWRSPGPTAGGLLRWDTKNGDGVDVASGIYFAVITDSAGNKTGGKLAVIR